MKRAVFVSCDLVILPFAGRNIWFFKLLYLVSYQSQIAHVIAWTQPIFPVGKTIYAIITFEG
jgi:hypothetical protein